VELADEPERAPTRRVVEQALRGLCCVEHRGGTIEDTGDGAGLLLDIDTAYFRQFLAPGRHLRPDERLAVGVVFFPVGEEPNVPHWQHEIDAVFRRRGLAPLGWRKVPTVDEVLGQRARDSRREIWQVLVGEGMVPSTSGRSARGVTADAAPPMLGTQPLDQALYAVKATIERNFRDLYVASLSAHTVAYKALCTGAQLAAYYPDLQDPALRARVALFHRRYSTNTFSNWYLAQPFRMVAHNGEINTVKANRAAVRNLEAALGLKHDILMHQGSDSADLDRLVELAVMQGRSLPETLLRTMPAAWRDLVEPSPEVAHFYQGMQRMLGPLGAWEGPAAVVATDGRHLVGALDRMGLRPLRWALSRDHLLVLASELGAVPVPPEELAQSGQLDPGEAIVVELATRRLIGPGEVLRHVLTQAPAPYAALAERDVLPLPRATTTPTAGSAAEAPGGSSARRPLGQRPDNRLLNLFGWTAERVRLVRTLSELGREPITSMGYDRPLAPLSLRHPPLTKYFKQIVAVVTNPPIDPIREGSAFDTSVFLGAAPELTEGDGVARTRPQYRLDTPFVTDDQLERMRRTQRPLTIERSTVAPCPPVHDSSTGGRWVAQQLAALTRDVLELVQRGEASIVVLSDRRVEHPDGGTAALDEEAGGRPRLLPLPMVLVVAAVHQGLTEAGLRRDVSLVVETGEVQEGHDAAVLLACGADAIAPWLFLRLAAAGVKPAAESTSESLVAEELAATTKAIAGLVETLRRIMSKMGITTLDGYRGSGLFEAVGLAPALVEFYLPGIASRLGGLELDDVYDDLVARYELQSRPQSEPEVGIYRKEVWQELQLTARGHDPESYGRFLDLIRQTPPVYLRDLLQFRAPDEHGAKPLPPERVVDEPAIIRSCFRGAAMSHGALHRTAHRAIAAAFNGFGAASNCGEGGEDRRRNRGGTWSASRSHIRQVASGRFGVDAHYLVNADELQIKIGQGAKPGEGGHLPGEKVTEEIALIRRTRPGVSLISPPPHHDIYSIEDLAQLVYHLRQVHPTARISVKIPAVTDIGTIAVGVAKSGADTIDVSGFEGGTGAAASSSIEHAGLPLERALAETHQALVLQGIRSTVRLRAEGGLKTGFDVAAALALGADEVSLGTALMIAEQCIFCHGCAKGNCPAGITTQSELVARRLMTDKKGRGLDVVLPDIEEERFDDAQRGVENYLRALATDLRGILASLGLERPELLTGRTELLRHVPRNHPRADKLDLTELLWTPRREPPRPTVRSPALAPVQGAGGRDATSSLNARILTDFRALPPDHAGGLTYPITTEDRAVGATLAGALAAGTATTPPGGVVLRFRGYAGQGFAFGLTEGVTMQLDGFANDGVAEAMSGGLVVVRPPDGALDGPRASASTVGNAAAYGATGGTLLVEGRAGQRLGVRNSAATIVAEGAGKYAFEYMTGGIGVLLGSAGNVLGSGMTGGVVYLLGPPPRVNDGGQLAPSTPVERTLAGGLRCAPLEASDAAELRTLLELHYHHTQSTVVPELLADWPAGAARFRKVVPAR
jgi:glutamate synthase domain-containing protein 2/glutamate synthase domain-containing protein 1/glutamate synthase domain-containing protein 3